jgi:hypothetical protein
MQGTRKYSRYLRDQDAIENVLYSVVGDVWVETRGCGNDALTRRGSCG